MSRGRQARFTCRQCGRSTMAASYWRARCGALLRHCGCPRVVTGGSAGGRRTAEPSAAGQTTLDRWMGGQRALPRGAAVASRASASAAR
eukprot:9949539-Alexandrium_andersonii.AAC.1